MSPNRRKPKSICIETVTPELSEPGGTNFVVLVGIQLLRNEKFVVPIGAARLPFA